MAKTPFSATKHDKSTLNSGNQYTKDDQMSIEALNYMIENGLYAVDTSERAVSISNSIVDTANNAVNIAENATNIAENATSTANSFDSQIKSAIATANEAKEMAQDALNSSTEGVGSQVKVNGQVVGVFDADTKLDKNGTANAATKDSAGNIIKDTYLPLTAGSNKPLSGDLYIPSGKYIRTNSSAVLGHSGSALNVGNPDLSMNLRGSSILSNQIMPNENGTIDFGSSSKHWKDGYFKDSVILNSSSANRILFKHNGNNIFDLSKSGDGAYMYMWDYSRNYAPLFFFGGFENASGTTEAAKKPFGYTQIRTKHTDSSGTERLHDFLFDTNGGFHIPSGGALYFD